MAGGAFKASQIQTAKLTAAAGTGLEVRPKARPSPPHADPARWLWCFPINRTPGSMWAQLPPASTLFFSPIACQICYFCASSSQIKSTNRKQGSPPSPQKRRLLLPSTPSFSEDVKLLADCRRERSRLLLMCEYDPRCANFAFPSFPSSAAGPLIFQPPFCAVNKNKNVKLSRRFAVSTGPGISLRSLQDTPGAMGWI